VTAPGAPGDLATELQRYRSADVVVGDGASTAPESTADLTLTLTSVAPSPADVGTLSGHDGVLLVFGYHARDEQAMLAFDARITEEYTAFYLTRGVTYTGVFHLDGPATPPLGEIIAFDAATVEDAERLGNEDLPQRIVDIEDECRTLQDRDASRFSLWLVPSGRA
jgi:hypothetical protein